jgi:hypothetical protein
MDPTDPDSQHCSLLLVHTLGLRFSLMSSYRCSLMSFDSSDMHVLPAVFLIRMFLGLPDLHPDP